VVLPIGPKGRTGRNRLTKGDTAVTGGHAPLDDNPSGKLARTGGVIWRCPASILISPAGSPRRRARYPPGMNGARGFSARLA
jgi:hypothetical protein